MKPAILMTGPGRLSKSKRTATLLALAICCLFPGAAYSQGAAFFIDLFSEPFSFPTPNQCSSQSVVTSGLHTPVKLTFTQHGNLLVAEAGDGPNTGRISLVDPANGHRRTLLDGLPSGFVPPSNSTSGPSGLAMRGRTLYITIGAGDSTLPGAALNTRIANPNPSSPIFSSVLAVDFTPHVEQTTEGFNLTWADQLALHNGSEVSLDNGGGDQIKVRLLADFPDYLPEPRKDEANNVRAPDPFGLVIAANQLYIVDSESNSIRIVEIQTGGTTTLTNFAPVSAGHFPAEAIPVGIRFFGDQLLVSLLTSYPFPTGGAQVRIVDPATGSDEPFITGLTTAVDVLPIRGRGRTSEFLTLELSADMQSGTPGRLRRYTSPDAAPTVIADCLNMSTSMARDERTGALYITEIFTGRIVKVDASTFSSGNNVFGFEPQPITARSQK
ncbi:MAG TPA: ScyD/ScyE family protein [Pyrinomonadaceae bacterium]